MIPPGSYGDLDKSPWILTTQTTSLHNPGHQSTPFIHRSMRADMHCQHNFLNPLSSSFSPTCLQSKLRNYFKAPWTLPSPHTYRPYVNFFYPHCTWTISNNLPRWPNENPQSHPPLLHSFTPNPGQSCLLNLSWVPEFFQPTASPALPSSPPCLPGL